MLTGGMQGGKTLNKIRSIHRGEAPVDPLNTSCKQCRYMERCEESGGTG
jgi:hypothetical protein